MSRYIDADAIAEQIKDFLLPISLMLNDIVQRKIEKAPTIDIVRCQDCKYWVYNFNGCSRNPCTEPWYATDGCTYGEREGE